MSSIEKINKYFEPVLFQVVGSTPTGIKDNLKTAGIKGNKEIGEQLSTVSIFASCVNKSTLENFISRPEFSAVRPVIVNALQIGGKANMTALTLLGHCLLTTTFFDNLTFVTEFRKKIGQNHIWAGSLDNGSLGEKQKAIMKEKARLTDVEQARLLGDGFLKFTGVKTAAMTAAEQEFWGEREPVVTPKSSPPRNTTQPSPPRSRPAPTTAPSFRPYTLRNSEQVLVDPVAADYYLAVGGNTEATMLDSIARRGIDTFNDMYRKASAADPERRGVSGTVMGR